MVSSGTTPVSRESPGLAMSRGVEGEGEASEMAASSRSETGNDKASKNGAFPFLGYTMGVWGALSLALPFLGSGPLPAGR